MKKIICLLTLMLLLTACAAPARDEAPPAESSAPAVSTPAEEFRNPGGQEMAGEAYEAIMASFGSKMFPEDTANPSYPSEFGDAYIEDNFLYVCLTDPSEQMQEKYRSLVPEPRILRFVEVEHSYNDLLALQMALVDIEGWDFATVGIDVMENEVDVGIPDISKEGEVRALFEAALPADIAERFETLPITFEEQEYLSLT